MVSTQQILAMDSDALEGHLQQLLRLGRPGQQFEECAEDGSPRVPSLVSVWLISQVGHAVGRQKVEQAGAGNLHVSMSHDQGWAVAFAVAALRSSDGCSEAIQQDQIKGESHDG